MIVPPPPPPIGAAVSPPPPPVHLPVIHTYHCPLCGFRLFEAAMGILLCGHCKREFVPSLSDDRKEYALSWARREQLSDDDIPY
jgi:hypothetical protein